MSDHARLAQLEAEHVELVLRRFDRSDAWDLGRSIAERALNEGFPVAVDVRTSTGILFHASLPGATADNDVWATKKAATALRFETSTALLEARIENGGRDMYEPGWLDPVDYAVAGGAVPIRVDGVGVVAVATVSGLPSADDHDLAVAGIRSLEIAGPFLDGV
ncbi:heme-binding protein [Microbacterium sp. ISL-103]|uniref:heme-binding protein n=1 Tax=Microbacterium sp. ISL-103 TaxID=2819156 RepID=UPI001BE80B08|nr:heme-binding protein [Microbacterium sp. ISL-103]MBT2476668.1 heme-binding protein [Microbacterium sp. ISL-103]